MRNELLTFLVPQTCLSCGRNAGGSFPLCPDCLEKWYSSVSRDFARSPDSAGRCVKCGRPLISAMNVCTTCRTTGLLCHIDRIFPLIPYTARSQDALVAWKLRGVRSLSPVFAALVASHIEQNPYVSGVPVIPVPPRPGKIAEKGWDQIRELSHFLARDHHVSVLNCLERTGGIQQKKLGRIARFANIGGHIVAVKGVRVPGSAVILDDLVTTGSTLDACAAALKAAGCEKVFGLTLFYD
jgi:predicted amidophosphoribosyltransferase